MISYPYHPSLRERVDAFLKGRNSNAGSGLPVVSEMLLPQAKWNSRDSITFFKEGYRQNSAVFACIRTLANAFAEAPLKVYTDETKKTPNPTHPLQALIKRPNEYMGEDEWWKFIICYAGIGGNAYGQIQPNNAGEPGALWPYHDMVMWPVPTKKKWIDHYNYSVDNGNTVKELTTQEILHFKWTPNPEQPWRGMSPLYPVGREVDTDSELTRYLFALLQNDAVTRTIIMLAPGQVMEKVKKAEFEQDWRIKFGGQNRNSAPAIIQNGGDIKRLALDMQELAFDALRGVPEARIAAAYGVPAIIAGLNIGLQRSTFANFQEARRMFVEQTIVPLWKAVASEVQNSVVPLFKDKSVYVDFDLAGVRALTENQEIRMRWTIAAYTAGILKRNEARVPFGVEPLADAQGEEFAPPPVAASAGSEPRGLNASGSSSQTDASTGDNAGKSLNGVEHSNVKELVIT